MSIEVDRLDGETKGEYVRRKFHESLPPDAREEYECIIKKDTPGVRRWTVRRKIKHDAQAGGAAETTG